MRLKWMISILVIATFLISVTAAAMLPAPAIDKGKGKANANGLEKIVFIHYKKGFAKPPCNNNGVCEPELGEKKSCADCRNGGGGSKCYAFLGKGVKWKGLPVDYVIHPDLDAGAVSAGAEEWDSHTSADLFGSYTIDHSATWDDDSPDGRNEMVFGDYPQDGVIAVAIIWGYFYGPPKTREIIEFDTLFDTDFAWGDATEDSTVMDLQNIATHEIGHGAGLGDLYETACSEETMYGYSWEGDIQKRDLNTGDITGIQELYGA
ncbi:MAG: matrixin family metalloprotease [Candidatus Aenigmarchaeota archaeon]|nr:matrixin family metalloprotease [Candidatus Aenigmarchaeota archaeon]